MNLFKLSNSFQVYETVYKELDFELNNCTFYSIEMEFRDVIKTRIPHPHFWTNPFLDGMVRPPLPSIYFLIFTSLFSYFRFTFLCLLFHFYFYFLLYNVTFLFLLFNVYTSISKFLLSLLHFTF